MTERLKKNNDINHSSLRWMPGHQQKGRAKRKEQRGEMGKQKGRGEKEELKQHKACEAQSPTRNGPCMNSPIQKGNMN